MHGLMPNMICPMKNHGEKPHGILLDTNLTDSSKQVPHLHLQQQAKVTRWLILLSWQMHRISHKLWPRSIESKPSPRSSHTLWEITHGAQVSMTTQMQQNIKKMPLLDTLIEWTSRQSHTISHLVRMPRILLSLRPNQHKEPKSQPQETKRLPLFNTPSTRRQLKNSRRKLRLRKRSRRKRPRKKLRKNRRPLPSKRRRRSHQRLKL